MAKVILAEIDWQAVDDRALELFSTSRDLEMDDSLLAALAELRDPDAVRRALLLLDADGRLSFSLAFKITRTTDRYFDAEPLPFDDSPATMPALVPALLAA